VTLANFGYPAFVVKTAEISVIKNNKIVGAQHICKWLCAAFSKRSGEFTKE